MVLSRCRAILPVQLLLRSLAKCSVAAFREAKRTDLEESMAQVTDPVCGMTIDSASAAGKADYQGQTYYFCSKQCKTQFESNPAKFLSTKPGARRESDQRPDMR